MKEKFIEHGFKIVSQIDEAHESKIFFWLLVVGIIFMVFAFIYALIATVRGENWGLSLTPPPVMLFFVVIGLVVMIPLTVLSYNSSKVESYRYTLEATQEADYQWLNTTFKKVTTDNNKIEVRWEGEQK